MNFLYLTAIFIGITFLFLVLFYYIIYNGYTADTTPHKKKIKSTLHNVIMIYTKGFHEDCCKKLIVTIMIKYLYF